MGKMADGGVSTYFGHSLDEGNMADESEDASSTYCSDDDMDCTCILTPKVTAMQDEANVMQDGGGVINYFTPEDVQELHCVDFQDKSGTVFVYPHDRLTSLSEDLRQRLNSLASKSPTVALVLPSFQWLPGSSRTPLPDGLVCDVMVITPGGCTLILTITQNDQSGNSRGHNTSLARDLTAYIREKALGSFKTVHGVFSTSDCSSEDNFKRKLQSLEQEALSTSIQHTFRLSHDKCKAVLSTVVSLLEGPPLPVLTTAQEQDKSLSVFKSYMNTEVWVRRLPRQLLNSTEVSLLSNRQSSGILMLPTSMHDHIQTHHPVILHHIRREMDGRDGWVLAQTSLINLLKTSDIIPPYEVFCDVIVMTPSMPMKILTFATHDGQSQNVYFYNDNLVQRVKEITCCGSSVRVEKKVIFLDESGQELSCITQTKVDQEELLYRPSCNELHDKITNDLLNVILSQQHILRDVETREDAQTEGYGENPLYHNHRPRIKGVVFWTFDGSSPKLSDAKITIEWSFEEDSQGVGDIGRFLDGGYFASECALNQIQFCDFQVHLDISNSEKPSTMALRYTPVG